VKNAFLAVEDARFYEHNGVDLVRIVGAFLEDIKSGSLSQGASTISQQLVKLTCLTGVKTISRKLQEAVMAYKLEQVYTKDQILEMYLNYIYFGNGAYGIEAAAKAYFGATTQTLTVSQAALLAGVIKSPTNYAPHLHLDRSVERRNLVLSLMADQGFISSEQEAQAKAEKVVLAPEVETKYDFFTAKELICLKRIVDHTWRTECFGHRAQSSCLGQRRSPRSCSRGASPARSTGAASTRRSSSSRRRG
jgi:membrane peptidoglycan carboxypeptidase